MNSVQDQHGEFATVWDLYKDFRKSGIKGKTIQLIKHEISVIVVSKKFNV